MNENLQKTICDVIRFFLQPLKRLSNLFQNDSSIIFTYLYFMRDGIEDQMEAAIKKNQNLTIVGKAGQGKTSLMHYIMIKLKKKANIYPIFIDLRERAIKNDTKCVIRFFVLELRKYFQDINIPVPEIKEATNRSNALDHLEILNDKLAKLPSDKISKKLVILLDDLDYSERIYYELLANYFMTYSSSDKTIFVLSVRPPMWNSIKTNEALRFSYYIDPVEVRLQDGNLQLLLVNRLKPVLNKMKAINNRSFISIFLKAFMISPLDRKLNKYLKAHHIDLNELEKEDLPDFFDLGNSFYAELATILYFNIRKIERVFETILTWEINGKNPSFKSDFVDAFLMAFHDDKLLVLDLVSQEYRTGKDVKLKHRDNAILQIVLEYFYLFEVADIHFYSTMLDYGINQNQANRALDILINEDYDLIEPSYAYDIDSEKHIHKTFGISKKGVLYVNNILRNPLYYSLSGYKKSNRSFYDDIRTMKK